MGNKQVTDVAMQHNEISLCHTDVIIVRVLANVCTSF